MEPLCSCRSSRSVYPRAIAKRTLDELPGWARATIDESRVARLAFLDDRDRPRVLPVTFALAAGAVWSAVDEKPKRVEGGELARVRYLRRRPEAALCVDRYDDDWSRLAWVQLLGRVEVREVGDEPEALGALAERYAAYRERSPAGPLLRLSVERALHWRADQGQPGA
jgi:PPOX class probable F420-dependent enzyme